MNLIARLMHIPPVEKNPFENMEFIIKIMSWKHDGPCGWSIIGVVPLVGGDIKLEITYYFSHL